MAAFHLPIVLAPLYSIAKSSHRDAFGGGLGAVSHFERLERMLRTWALTVPDELEDAAQISGLVKPLIMSHDTSRFARGKIINAGVACGE